jgi:UPF0176 protein
LQHRPLPTIPKCMFIVSALYHFTRFDDPKALQGPMLSLCEHEGIKGTILIAAEGINGTVAGPSQGIARLWKHIAALPGCENLDHKESIAQSMPFKRMKVRLKKEIVTMGQPNIDPRTTTGHYVEASDWNALINLPDVAVIDTRNDYEVGIGTFEGAIDPQTKTFREFPEWWAKNKHRFQDKKIAMFCTGGIRCEKSTNFLLGEGVDEVYHLKGGILKYLEQVPKEKSTWTGECFVFDNRVSVGHGLIEGNYDQCYACRRPITGANKEQKEYIKGMQCHQCMDEYTDEDRARFGERQRQMDAAKE